MNTPSTPAPVRDRAYGEAVARIREEGQRTLEELEQRFALCIKDRLAEYEALEIELDELIAQIHSLREQISFARERQHDAKTIADLESRLDAAQRRQVQAREDHSEVAGSLRQSKAEHTAACGRVQAETASSLAAFDQQYRSRSQASVPAPTVGSGPYATNAAGLDQRPMPTAADYGHVPGPKAQSPVRLRRTYGIGGVIVIVIVAVIIAAVTLSGGPGWPASVATMQAEIAQACQLPNLTSEPSGVNFACAQPSNQVLWVYALMTSNGNPRFVDAKTGRVGLEPINPKESAGLITSVNLSHPFNPRNPIDSLAVAARAINDIIGGAVVEQNGLSVPVEGLESVAANCRSYTGSALQTKRAGYPTVCARPLLPADWSVLVGDVFGFWVTKSGSTATADAETLFAYASNPGNPQVQSILAALPHKGWL